MSKDNFDLPPTMREQYHYLVFRLDNVLPLFSPPDPNHNDAYIAVDATSMALVDCLAKGYRWIRTDGEYAIFEKTTLLLPGRNNKKEAG